MKHAAAAHSSSARPPVGGGSAGPAVEALTRLRAARRGSDGSASGSAGRSAPPPLVVGTTAFASGSAFMAIAAIVQTPSVGHVRPQVDLIGNAVLTAASLALLVTATVRVAREPGAGSS